MNQSDPFRGAVASMHTLKVRKHSTRAKGEDKNSGGMRFGFSRLCSLAGVEVVGAANFEKFLGFLFPYPSAEIQDSQVFLPRSGGTAHHLSEQPDSQ
jgi:hypothetical protein